MSNGTVLWQPTSQQIESSNMIKFLAFVNAKYNLSLKDYQSLYNFSLSNYQHFWQAIVEFFKVNLSGEYHTVSEGESMFVTNWFPGAQLNFAEHLLRKKDDSTAIISEREGFEAVKLNYAQLNELTQRVVSYLRSIGIKKGDRVAALVCNTPEAIIFMLAATSLGAIYSSCSPDFGETAILDRFEQIQPVIFIAVEGYYYGGAFVDCMPKIQTISKRLTFVKKHIIIPVYEDFMGKVVFERFSQSEYPHCIRFDEICRRTPGEPEFVQTEFNHPVYILYSSGTTGKPKGIVHGAGGTLLQHLKELSLHTNITENSVVFYYTTCGWMMWNWLVSSLSLGATIVLYDGNPFAQGPLRLWRLIDKHNISVFGVSAKYIAACQKAEIHPAETLLLNSLQVILSTGSPLPDSGFEWIYTNVKNDVQLSSISGGTDIVSCFMLGNPVAPVYKGEIQTAGLGMAVEVFDTGGKPLDGEKGELVCTKPFPSMPVYFWNDPSGKRYYDSYFAEFPDIWRHGDFLMKTSNNGYIVYGRSDATLNPGGVRIGTAEIYRVVEQFTEIGNSLVIGYQYDNDVRVVLFVVLSAGAELSDDLHKRIKFEIRKQASPRHVPDVIISVPDIPMTMNGKKSELAVSRVIAGLDADNKDALFNPSSLEFYTALRSTMPSFFKN